MDMDQDLDLSQSRLKTRGLLRLGRDSERIDAGKSDMMMSW